MANNNSDFHNISDEYARIRALGLTAMIPLSLAIAVANSIALVVFLRKTFRVKKSNYLLVNLTLADFLVGVSYGVFSIMFSYNYFSGNNGIKDANGPVLSRIRILTGNASIYTLSVISVERVLAVFWPFHHRLAKRCHYFTAIALVWILAALPFLRHSIERNINPDGSLWYVISIVVLISLLTIFISYFSIWIKMKFFTKFRNCRTIQENSKLTKTLFIVTVVSLGTWLPRTIRDSVASVHDIPRTKVNNILYYILSALLLSNSFWNLIVYSVRMPEFRRELRQVFCKTRTHPNRYPASQISFHM